MNSDYINQKTKEILTFCFTHPTFELEQTKKFIRLILEAVWLDGKSKGVQKVREILRQE